MKRLLLLCVIAMTLVAAQVAAAAVIADSATISGTKTYKRSVANSGGSFSVTVGYTVKWAAKSVILVVYDSDMNLVCGDHSDAIGSPLSCVLTDAPAGTYNVWVSTLNGKPVPIAVVIEGAGIS